MRLLNIFNQDFNNIVVNLQQCYSSLYKSQQGVLEKRKEYNQNLNIYNQNKDYFSKSSTGKPILENIETKFKQYQSNFISFLKNQEQEQNKIQKSIDKIYQNNPDLKYLSEYSQFISENKFHELIVTLTKGYQNGFVEKSKVLDLKSFKRIDFKKGSVYVKDSRTHFGDCIVINEFNEILLLKRNKLDDFEAAKYCLPGGHVEEGEDFQYAALRELEEETGIKATHAISSGNYLDNKVVIHYFTVKVKKDECNIFLEEREHQQYEWVPLSKINEYSLLKNLKDNFEEVILIPSSVLNPVLPPNIFSYYNNGNFVKSEDIESLFEANNLYNNFKKGESSYSFENHIKEKRLDIQTYSIYNLSSEPIYGVKFNNNIEKSLSHKYFKREGTPGNYKYYYTEQEYKEAKDEDLKKLEVNSNDPYTYKDTNVLVNKKNIKDFEKLKQEERDETSKKINLIKNLEFSAKGFKNLHKEIFGDLYNWAGETRTVNLSNGDVSFAPMRFLEEGLSSEFAKINNDIKNKNDFTNEEWVNKAGNHFGELIFIHPFREGNGRTTRKFLDEFLKQKNIEIDWKNIEREDYYEASKLSINRGDNPKLVELFNGNILK